MHLQDLGVITVLGGRVKWRPSVLVDDINLRSVLEEYLKNESFCR